MNSRLRPAPAGIGCLAAACLSLAWNGSNADSQTIAPLPTSPTAGCELTEGAVVRGPKEYRQLALVFTGHEFAEGGQTILAELTKHKARAAFFLTGDFLANPEFKPLIRQMVDEGHFLGPHSDKHLLYCTWDKSKKTLVSREAFTADLRANMEKLARFGVHQPRYFLPPYEHYSGDIAAWTAQLGMQLINFTPGTRSNADYTEDTAANFVSSRMIFESIIRHEHQDSHGLNGFLLLLHLGAGPRRTDRFHTRFGDLLDDLAVKGYQFVRVDELLEPRKKAR